jgi:hypothetical protein
VWGVRPGKDQMAFFIERKSCVSSRKYRHSFGLAKPQRNCAAIRRRSAEPDGRRKRQPAIVVLRG